MSKLKSFIFICLCLFFVTCLTENKDAEVSLSRIATNSIGKKGVILIEANSITAFIKDTSRNICFKSKILFGKNEIEVDCGLWKPSENKLYAFCNVDANTPPGKYTINFNEIPKFVYQAYNVTLKSNSTFEFDKLDENLVSLYSEEQTINILEGKDSYELEFDVLSYNQEVLYLKILGYETLNCRQEKDKLICPIKKVDLEQDLNKNKSRASVYYIGETSRNADLPLVGEITILDNIAKKTDIYIGITKLIENVGEGETQIAYETNITNIDKVKLYAMGDTTFYLNYENTESGSGGSKGSCGLYKHDSFPLLLACSLDSTGTYKLGNIQKEIVIDKNIKYKFIIQPVKNEEKIDYSKKDNGASIMWLYPKILNFTSQDTLYIVYSSESADYLKGMTFNKDKGDLSCKKMKNSLLNCTIPKSHFEGKESGYYFTQHTNHLNGKSAFYESSPINVILPKPDPKPTSKPSKGSIYSISLYYSLLLILIIL